MGKYVISYAGCAAVMVALDVLWLGYIAPDFYKRTIGHLLAPKPDLVVAALFYVLYVAGVVFFAVAPALTAGGWPRAALLGAFAYMTYDLTNLATLRDFPVIVAAADIAWGAFITACAATGGYFAVQAAGR